MPDPSTLCAPCGRVFTGPLRAVPFWLHQMTPHHNHLVEIWYAESARRIRLGLPDPYPTWDRAEGNRWVAAWPQRPADALPDDALDLLRRIAAEPCERFSHSRRSCLEFPDDFRFSAPYWADQICDRCRVAYALGERP